VLSRGGTPENPYGEAAGPVCTVAKTENPMSDAPLPKLKNVITPFPYSVDAEAPIDEAVGFMRTHKIRHLPVLANGKLTSVVSDRDIKLLLGPDFAYPSSHELKVRDAMVQDCYVVDLATPLATVLRHMAAQHIGSAVVTRRGKLAGVFTANDACRAFANHLDDITAIDGEDAS
jgi:acetoin utilization protein AcuB